jgi:hypothetical protein
MKGKSILNSSQAGEFEKAKEAFNRAKSYVTTQQHLFAPLITKRAWRFSSLVVQNLWDVTLS